MQADAVAKFGFGHAQIFAGINEQTILFDNFTPEQVREAVKLVAGRAVTEMSGGVNLRTVRAYAEAGVNVVSSGSLTHSTPALDIGLDFELDER